MQTDTATPDYREPEEILEQSLAAALSSAVAIPVEGAITPATAGTVKRLSSDTFVSVVVDLASQDGDITEPVTFLTLNVSVSVHFALADDASGTAFRDECRRVRAALVALTGKGCAALNADGLAVDGFILATTATTFEGGDNPTNVKTYTATASCRAFEPQPTITENREEPTNG